MRTDRIDFAAKKARDVGFAFLLGVEGPRLAQDAQPRTSSGSSSTPRPRSQRITSSFPRWLRDDATASRCPARHRAALPPPRNSRPSADWIGLVCASGGSSTVRDQPAHRFHPAPRTRRRGGLAKKERCSMSAPWSRNNCIRSRSPSIAAAVKSELLLLRPDSLTTRVTRAADVSSFDMSVPFLFVKGPAVRYVVMHTCGENLCQSPDSAAAFRRRVTIHEETVHVVPEEEHLCDSPRMPRRCKWKDIPLTRAAN